MLNIFNKVVNECIMSDGRVSWTEVQARMKELGEEGAAEMFRSRWRRSNPGRKRRVSDVGVKEIERMRAAGANVEVWFEDGELWCENKPVLELGTTEISVLHEAREIKIALLGDTHIGSKKTAWGALHEFYHYAYEAGVREFYHAGDLTDGMYKNRDNSFFEQDAHGFSEQVQMVVDKYPRLEGAMTYFITGNHDATHMRNGGANVGETVEMGREDMCYLGHNFAKVWLTPEVDLNLIHPTDCGAQAVSHKLQKIIDGAERQRKSKIVAVGHYHKMAWVYWKDTHGFMVPSFQYQTEFMRDNNLKSYVGGFILTIKLDRHGKLVSLTPEFVELE